MSNSILVLAEHFRGELSEITFEMTGKGKSLARQINASLDVVIIGKNVRSFIPSLGAADTVITVENDNLELPLPDIFADILSNIAAQRNPALILVGGTNLSAGIGPVLSSKLNSNFINFCKNITFDNGKFNAESQLFGGKIMSDVVIESDKSVISIYPGSFPSDSGKVVGNPKIEYFPYSGTQGKVGFLSYIIPEAGDVDVTKEPVLVSVGRGIENSDNIELAEELAGVFGGAVAASRPVIDQGWLPLNRQIGKSGMIVKPKLYLALGISGAPEHAEGMKDSELIIAINKDPDAPIFNFAHYGVCTDLLDLVPLLTEKLIKRKN